MARPKISLLPDSLDLALYAGDGATIQMTVTDADQAPVDLDGPVIAQIRVNKVSSSPSATFSVDTTAASLGELILSLTGVQTAALVGSQTTFKGLWDVQWTPADKEPVTLIQGRVECTADVSR